MPLVLPGLVVQEDPYEDEDGAGGAEDGDVVTEHDDAQPNRQSVFNSTGNAEEEMRIVTLCINIKLIKFMTWMGSLSVL